MSRSFHLYIPGAKFSNENLAIVSSARCGTSRAYETTVGFGKSLVWAADESIANETLHNKAKG